MACRQMMRSNCAFQAFVYGRLNDNPQAAAAMGNVADYFDALPGGAGRQDIQTARRIAAANPTRQLDALSEARGRGVALPGLGIIGMGLGGGLLTQGLLGDDGEMY
jgi:hypothetical protein